MKYLLLMLALLPLISVAQTADEILAKAIRYHDPQNEWPALKAIFHYTETRPDGEARETVFDIDNAKGIWKLNRNEDEIYEIVNDEVTVLKGDKEPSRGLLLRNYYLYLWGLPMKLKDKSTPKITRTEDEKVNGNTTFVLRVAYEKETYYFSFDQQSGRMLEYRFYKDEEAGKGERIKLEKEITFNNLKLPQQRSWYTLPEKKYLGTDTLDEIKNK